MSLPWLPRRHTQAGTTEEREEEKNRVCRSPDSEKTPHRPNLGLFFDRSRAKFPIPLKTHSSASSLPPPDRSQAPEDLSRKRRDGSAVMVGFVETKGKDGSIG